MLTLPENFDPETDMLAREVDGRHYRSPRTALQLAYDLVQNGAREDLDQAERTIHAVLDCQERNPSDPHRGNFLWEREDEVVEDLNAVQFILFELVPILTQWEDRLSKAISARMREAVRLGLEEIERIDVHLDYTNIVLKDITNSVLGGELLKDRRIRKRGLDKLVRWLAYTDESGIPRHHLQPGQIRARNGTTMVRIRCPARLAIQRHRHSAQSPARHRNRQREPGRGHLDLPHTRLRLRCGFPGIDHAGESIHRASVERMHCALHAR